MPDQPAGFGRHPFLAPSTAIRPTPVRAYLGATPFGVFETEVDSIPPLGPLDSKESHGDQISKKSPMGILKLLSLARHGALPWPGRGSSPKTGTHAVSHLLSSLTTKTIARLGLRAARHFALCITAGLRLLLFPAKTLIFARFHRQNTRQKAFFVYSKQIASFPFSLTIWIGRKSCS